MSDETTLLPCPFCGSDRAPEISDVGECEECIRFDDCLRREKNHTCEGCDEWERPMFVVCNYNISGCGTSGPYRKTKTEAIAAWNTRADRHAYEQRITGDGSDWGEIMRDAYDDLMASACESCTHEQMARLADHIRAELGNGTCKLEPLSALDVTLNMLELTEWGACSDCGCAVPMDARFCNECGKAVKR